MKKRFAAMLLCLCAISVLLPKTAFAADSMTVQINGNPLTSGQEVPCGEGTILFDSGSNTLTLENATISETDPNASVIVIDGEQQRGELTIRLIGDNKITSTSENVIPLAFFSADVTIQGTSSDSLTVESNSDCISGNSSYTYSSLTIEGCTMQLTSHRSFGIAGDTKSGQICLRNKANITVNSAGIAVWAGPSGLQITDSTINATTSGSTNTIYSDGDISISNSTVEAVGTSSDAYPAIYAYGNMTVAAASNVTAQSSGMRGLYIENSLSVTDSTVTASGNTNEGIIAVDTFTIENSKVTASGKPNSIKPAIVTNHLNISASNVTAKGGIHLYDWYSGNATARSFLLTPANGKSAEFKVDGSNWDGSAAVHFKEGAESPYDTAVNFSESEMNWLNAYRYIHIGEHIHSGGTADCHTPAVCDDCGRPYGTADPNTHIWEKDFTVDKAPTCTEAGQKSIHCQYCSATKDSETIQPLGHSYKNGKCTICGASQPEQKPEESASAAGPVSSDDNDHPQTGDNSVMLPWILTLLVSGCAITGTIVYNKRRKGMSL